MAMNKKMVDSSLANKLDEDLDAFLHKTIEKNKNYRYAHSLSEDNWEEELENIPLFMTKSPELIDHQTSPALSAMQTMKYEENDPNGKALAYKNDGNQEFKKGNYRKAISIYTEGIKINCEDSTVLATLFCNRANAHFKLGNYRSSLNDSTEAKNIQLDYVKAIFRGASSCLELGLHEDAIKWCKEGLLVDSGMKSFQDLLKRASLKQKQQERDERKKKAMEKTRNESNNRLADAIMSRGIKLRSVLDENGDDSDDDGDFELHAESLLALDFNSQHFPAGAPCVHLDDDGILHWPVVFVYPEYGQTDFIESFNETHSFSDNIQVMFGCERPAWDKEDKYKPSELEVYYEAIDKTSLVSVKRSTSLSQVLSDPRYVVCGGTPSFIILSKETSFQREFKMRYDVER